mgnify:CR=1 FL=1|tara:strand:- start:2757 stop:2945 length:189 start_codon:yes stop_codon:yes gene_type:complete
MDRVVPDSERISCEDLKKLLKHFPEVDCCFKAGPERYLYSKRTIAAANKKLKIAKNNLRVLK